MRQSCRTLPLTLALWLSFTLLIANHGQAQVSYENARLLREAMEDAHTPAVNGSRELHFAGVAEPSQILRWVEGALVPLLNAEGLRHGQVRHTQQLVGFARITQRRGQNTSNCEHLGEVMERFYSGGCHPDSGAALEYGPADLDYAFRPISGQENRFQAWLEIGRDAETVRHRVRSLEDDHWIDRSTQEVHVEAVFLNAEAYVYSHLDISFISHREGWLERGLLVRPLPGAIYPHWSFILVDAVWIALMVILAVSTLMEVAQEQAKGLLWLHLLDPYMWMDCFSIVFGLAIALFFWVLVKELEGFEGYIARLGNMPEYAVSEAPASRTVEFTLKNEEYQGMLTEVFSLFDRVGSMTEWHRLCTFWYSLIIVVRFFRAFRGQPRIAVLLQSLAASVDFVLHFLAVFLILVANFALSGYILFGEQMDGWSTLGRSVNRLFLVLFGAFDYDEFHGVLPVTAALWFSFFYIFTVLLLVNLLTAAVLTRYLGVRERLGEPGATISQQASGYLKQLQWTRSYQGSQKTVPDDKLLELISGATDPAHVKRLCRMGVDRRLRTREDLAKAEQDPFVDVEFLVARGCDRQTAARLLQRCSQWKHQMAMTSSPSHRLMLLVARHMTHMRTEAERMQLRLRTRVDKASRAVDRIDLKHAKCVALAKRVRKAQELPAGWTFLLDEATGRKYLRHEATGLTSWTLPRTLM
mmetsp:Transcript_84696/g.274373  ORF Transcript_84696/g.274373 Transcript_84696/m.274373 type:complete len:697 (-) Transcript_84696:43-2133(-)